MKTNNSHLSGTEGILPSAAPLSNPYVPFQAENAQAYPAKEGLNQGTLFSGLNLPFLGMVSSRTLPPTPLVQLQALDFAIQELALYLDTHRDDTEALELYQEYQREYRMKKDEYIQEAGPLTHAGSQGKEYRWLDDPWPWEYCANQEV